MKQVPKFPILGKLPNILKPPVLAKFLDLHKIGEKKQEIIYACTYNHTAIYKAGTYYFCFRINRAYRNLTALKRLL